ncbi:hypothetical protein ACIBEJ_43600 [Nonomuraea sp. NPDC050790]|uniref:hypothetical protein n=1 Tax=Nonomuraea sp. NPDC050790 TaxID=3364371 RepID=UPI0037B29E24
MPALPREHDPKLGISGLPPAAREAVYDVAYFYQNFIAFQAVGILDKRLLAMMNMRTFLVWEAIKPFVEREREITHETGPHLLRILQVYTEEQGNRVYVNPASLFTNRAVFEPVAPSPRQDPRSVERED